MSEKKYFNTTINCTICGKEGVIQVRQNSSIEMALQRPTNSSGFKYTKIFDETIDIFCENCVVEGEELIADQVKQREFFLKGE